MTNPSGTAVAGAATRAWQIFGISFAIYFAMALTWAAATPMFGVPDEISHMIRAAASSRGDIDGRTLRDGNVAYLAPRILTPGSNNGSVRQPCYAFDRQLSPSCVVFGRGSGDVLIVSTASAYPASYYLLVGWPSSLAGGLPGLYLMRAASALIFAALLALATVSLARDRVRPIAYAGLAVAVTPMVWFLGGSVNPSALSVAAGIAAWCGGYVLAAGGQGVNGATAMRFGLPLCLLLLLRRDSILWGGVIVVGLGILVSRARLIELARSRPVLAWAAASFASAFYAASVGASQGPGVLSATGLDGSAPAAFGRLLTYLEEMVGVLGWLDTPLPRAAYLLWYLCMGLLLLRAIGEARPRMVAAVMFVIFAVGGAIVAIGANVYPYFQGRYGLPAAVGVPLLAALGLATTGGGPTSVIRRPARVVIATSLIVQALAFYQQLRRYALPGSEALWIFGSTVWRPPTAPISVLLALNVAFTAALAIWWSGRFRHTAAASVPDDPGREKLDEHVGPPDDASDAGDLDLRRLGRAREAPRV